MRYLRTGDENLTILATVNQRNTNKWTRPSASHPDQCRNCLAAGRSAHHHGRARAERIGLGRHLDRRGNGGGHAHVQRSGDRGHHGRHAEHRARSGRDRLETRAVSAGGAARRRSSSPIRSPLTDGSPTSLLVPIDSLDAATAAPSAARPPARMRRSGTRGPRRRGRRRLAPRTRVAPRTRETRSPRASARCRGSHDGASAFTGELHFSEAPEGLSYTTVAGGLLAVTGATVDKARRLTAGSNLAWEVTLTPSQSGDITITLPPRACSDANAVCAGGRALGACGFGDGAGGDPSRRRFRACPPSTTGRRRSTSAFT